MFTSTKTEDFDKSEVEFENRSFEIDEEQLIEKYQLNECVDWIVQNKFERTCLQFPENLLCDSTPVSLYLQKALNKVVYILADTSYGSCCVDEVAAAHVNGDSIIHFGHACLSPVMKLPVFYVLEKKPLNIEKFVECLDSIQYNSIVVFYEDVYHHLYSQLCNLVKEKKNVCISKLKVNQKNEEIQENERTICGRVLSSNSDESTSAAVYIGDESITLTNIVMGLPDFMWYRFTENGDMMEYNVSRNKFLMQKNYLIEKVKEANVLGILIGTLGIKNYLKAVERVKILAKNKGKKCYTLVVGKPNTAKLANFPEIDIFVYLTCQENSLLHNFKGYYKPIVSLYENVHKITASDFSIASLCKMPGQQSVKSTCSAFYDRLTNNSDREQSLGMDYVEMALGKLSHSRIYNSNFREFLEGGSFYYEATESQAPTTDSEPSQALLERNPGTVIESSGSEFLMSRSWRGLEQNLEKKEVGKAIKGRTGVAQSYDNEVKTLSEETEKNP